MSAVKQVKVDNWGIYFLQRLKHFFNRTDYCDLTLQFQDNAQLKVHRLVLSACTEYFELLERTCEMYEDCLVMPDDLQADVVVPIVNFMYTGQLEFKMDLLDKLHQTAEIMSMPVLSKLLDSHRPKTHKITHSYAPKQAPKRIEATKETIKSITPTELVTTATLKTNYKRSRSYEQTTVYRDKKVYLPLNRKRNHNVTIGPRYRDPSPIPLDKRHFTKVVSGDPRPTRYELPEELDTDNIFENSFCSISYTSQPLMVHPETQKQYSKRPRLAGESSGSKNLGLTTVDIVECKKRQEGLFEESIAEETEAESEIFPQTFEHVKLEPTKDTSLLFDQILETTEEPTKFAIERKNNQSVKTFDKSVSENLDHAKIISEVLKKYPHLVKSNKNIKLKILNTPSKGSKKAKVSPGQTLVKTAPPIVKNEKESDYTFETDVIDSKQAARLIAMGAENVDGPWICLICGTPGKAMNFTSYFKFRRHLVEVHNEKPVLNICEYCGQRSTKRNYLLHHLYSKHGVKPPPQFHFPKCNNCNYIALTESLLVKHKASHTETKNFRCNVCPAAFNSSSLLLSHIQRTGHKYGTEKKINLQCIYCQKVFMREGNLCAHLKSHHKNEAVRDSIIDDSDEEHDNDKGRESIHVKTEPSPNDFEEIDIQYQIQQRPDGNIQVVTKKTQEPGPSGKQTILNSGYVSQVKSVKPKAAKSLKAQTEYVQEFNDITQTHGEIVVIDNNEYILRDNQLIPRGIQPVTEEYILADQSMPTLTSEASMDYTNIHNSNIQENIQQPNVLLKNAGDLTQPIPIYVSNEEEYKALMASNQSIIVENTNSNKMLTVLTAPHASNLESTSIDMDNTQSSDMMIIQDNFPINVSEAVASDNSNIVVVYSHQVDQNKQFQLLTTQGLEAQFVQSSAILTQNYETITTTTPIINAPAEVRQVGWQNNIQQMINNNEIEITPVSTIPNVVETQISNSGESEKQIDELPPIQLNSNTENTTLSDTPTSGGQDLADIPNNDENLIYENDEEITDVQNETSMEVDEESTIEQPVVDDNADTSKITNPLDNVPLASETEIEENDLPLQQMETEESEQTTDSQETEITNETLLQQEDINIANPTPELENSNLENIEIAVPESASNICTNPEPEIAPEDTEDNDKLRLETSLMSEEDNTDQVDETQEITDTPNNPPTNMECEELEESIENIQQEVEKITETSSTAEYENAETGVETSQNESEDLNNTAVSSQEESDHEENIPAVEKPVPVETQEKISSLLNDWDDSQEDNSGNENVPTPTESGEATESDQIDPDVATEPLDKENDKQDNIKSLVSDWDEDEEENKE